MGLLDGILGQLGDGAGNVAIEAIANKFGIDPQLAETAVAALTQAHPQPADTVSTAAQQTGIDPSVLSGIVEQLGGDGVLGQLAEQAAQNPQLISSIIGAAGSFLGSKN
ncbi:MAG: hypothetical protein AB7F98_14760 [Novosphingobium sp.]